MSKINQICNNLISKKVALICVKNLQFNINNNTCSLRNKLKNRI